MEKRLIDRSLIIHRAIAQSGKAIINKWAGGEPLKKAARRFFYNVNVGLEALIKMVPSQTQWTSPPAGRHILSINDTSEINFYRIAGRLKANDKHIGPLSDNKSPGFLLHPCLAVDAQAGTPYGIPSTQVWNRKYGAPTKKDRKNQLLPISEKESNKWIIAARETKDWLPQGNTVTMVSDRESDIYEYLCVVPDEDMDILIRGKRDRKLKCGKTMSEKLKEEEWQGGMYVKVKATKKRTAHTAFLQVRWTEVEIKKPADKHHLLDHCPASVKMTVVEVLEHPQSILPGEPAVHWRLVTTHQVNDLADAMQVIKWYVWRWWSEDYFRVLKSEGLEIENSQLSKGIALKKLVVSCLSHALRILMLRQARQGDCDYPASVCFDEQEVEYLEEIAAKIEPNRKGRRNPHPPRSLAWASWVIALLGGWSPADLQKRPPGVITLARGLKVFEQRYQGWNNALEYRERKSREPAKKVVYGD